MTYGEALQTVLDEKQVSKAELARRVGKSRSYISQLISGKISEPTLKTAYKIANSLETTVDYFVVLMEQ